MRTLTQVMETAGRTLQEASENCPPGYERFDKSETKAVAIAVACIAGALLLAGTGACITVCCKRVAIEKRALSFGCGAVAIVLGLGVGLFAGMTALRMIGRDDGDCVPIPTPPESSGNYN